MKALLLLISLGPDSPRFPPGIARSNFLILFRRRAGIPQILSRGWRKRARTYRARCSGEILVTPLKADLSLSLGCSRTCSQPPNCTLPKPSLFVRLIPSCVTGVLGPHSNAHGPNEFLDIEYCKRVVTCVAAIVGAHGTRNTREPMTELLSDINSAYGRIQGAAEDKLVQSKASNIAC